jgi:hypothetical protein
VKEHRSTLRISPQPHAGREGRGIRLTQICLQPRMTARRRNQPQGQRGNKAESLVEPASCDGNGRIGERSWHAVFLEILAKLRGK